MATLDGNTHQAREAAITRLAVARRQAMVRATWAADPEISWEDAALLVAVFGPYSLEERREQARAGRRCR